MWINPDEKHNPKGHRVSFFLLSITLNLAILASRQNGNDHFIDTSWMPLSSSLDRTTFTIRLCPLFILPCKVPFCFMTMISNTLTFSCLMDLFMTFWLHYCCYFIFKRTKKSTSTSIIFASEYLLPIGSSTFLCHKIH